MDHDLSIVQQYPPAVGAPLGYAVAQAPPAAVQLLDVPRDGVGYGLVLRPARSADDDNEAREARAGRHPQRDDVGRLTHVGGPDNRVDERYQGIGAHGPGGEVGRVDGVREFGGGGYGREDVVHLRPIALGRVRRDLLRGAAISLPRRHAQGRGGRCDQRSR